MFKVTVKRNDLTRFPQVLEAAQKQAEAEVRRRLLFVVAPAILQSAKLKCPVLWGDLQRSGRSDTYPNRVVISFGGDSPKLVPPSEYAEQQHEDIEISHAGPRMSGGKPIKYVYLYLKGWTARPSAEGRTVGYAKRDPAEAHPKRGMAQFLFGNENSALESLWDDQTAQIETAAHQVFRMYMRA